MASSSLQAWKAVCLLFYHHHSYTHQHKFNHSLLLETKPVSCIGVITEEALIIHWVANDPGATWQKLVEAMRISNEKVTAEKLAQDIGASSIGID